MAAAMSCPLTRVDASMCPRTGAHAVAPPHTHSVSSIQQQALPDGRPNCLTRLLTLTTRHECLCRRAFYLCPLSVPPRTTACTRAAQHARTATATLCPAAPGQTAWRTHSPRQITHSARPSATGRPGASPSSLCPSAAAAAAAGLLLTGTQGRDSRAHPCTLWQSWGRQVVISSAPPPLHSETAVAAVNTCVDKNC